MAPGCVRAGALCEACHGIDRLRKQAIILFGPRQLSAHRRHAIAASPTDHLHGGRYPCGCETRPLPWPHPEPIGRAWTVDSETASSARMSAWLSPANRASVSNIAPAVNSPTGACRKASSIAGGSSSITAKPTPTWPGPGRQPPSGESRASQQTRQIPGANDPTSEAVPPSTRGRPRIHRNSPISSPFIVGLQDHPWRYKEGKNTFAGFARSSVRLPAGFGISAARPAQPDSSDGACSSCTGFIVGALVEFGARRFANQHRHYGGPRH